MKTIESKRKKNGNKKEKSENEIWKSEWWWWKEMEKHWRIGKGVKKKKKSFISSEKREIKVLKGKIEKINGN